MIRLYNAALFPLRIALAAWGSFRILSGRRGDEWAERLARRVPRVEPGGIWVHGASVGEARIVVELARGLRDARPTIPLSVSALTATGRGQLPGPPRVDAAFFLPFDFSGLPSRILGAVRPRLLVIVETELWPNLLSEAQDAKVSVVTVNGRLSETKMASYRRLTRLYRPLLSHLDAVGVRSDADARRFRELGVLVRMGDAGLRSDCCCQLSHQHHLPVFVGFDTETGKLVEVQPRLTNPIFKVFRDEDINAGGEVRDISRFEIA